MKDMYEGERITAQEPRNMAQGGRIGFKYGSGELGKEKAIQAYYDEFPKKALDKETIRRFPKYKNRKNPFEAMDYDERKNF